MATVKDVSEVTLAMGQVSMEVVQQGPGGKRVDRHCGFCLDPIPADKVRLCSGCKRRAYCSRECQKADWKVSKTKPAYNGKIHGYGQGHKNWCGLPYCEEDLDWKVDESGQGLVALKDIPQKSRIIVEGAQRKPRPGMQGYHPAVDDFPPPPRSTGVDIGTKFDFYSCQTEEEGVGVVGLRFVKSTHNCQPNIGHVYDEEFFVVIAHADREIKAGEEIQKSFVPYNNIFGIIVQDLVYDSDELRRYVLELKGIICPLDCVCRNENNIRLLKICEDLYEECERDWLKKPVLEKFEKIIEIAKELGCNLGNMAMLYSWAGRYAVSRRETVEKGRAYMKMILDIMRAIHHPQNKDKVLLLEGYLADINKAPTYLVAESKEKYLASIAKELSKK